jgi:hypothetical protein
VLAHLQAQIEANKEALEQGIMKMILKFQAPLAFWLSSTQDYAAAVCTPAVGYVLDLRRINP